MPCQSSIFAVGEEIQIDAVDFVVLRPVDGAPRVAHVLVVDEVADPAASAEAKDDSDVLKKFLLGKKSYLVLKTCDRYYTRVSLTLSSFIINFPLRRTGIR